MRSGCLNHVRLLGIDRLEVFYVPGINDFRSNLRGALEEKGVVNATADKSAFRSLLGRLVVFVLIESNDGQAIPHFVDEK